MPKNRMEKNRATVFSVSVKSSLKARGLSAARQHPSAPVSGFKQTKITLFCSVYLYLANK
jgi:hypothetical protein